MKDFFLDKFQYNFDTNNRIMELLMGYGTEAPKNALKWMSHIFNAQEIWNARIRQTAWKYGVWHIHPMPRWHEVNEALHAETLDIILHNNLDMTIQYMTTEGTKHTNTLAEILFHIINHSTYHRGQIAFELREHNLEPISTDYIFYRRSD